MRSSRCSGDGRLGRAKGSGGSLFHLKTDGWSGSRAEAVELSGASTQTKARQKTRKGFPDNPGHPD